ncbi:uncharacterized protein [Chelonus insularis]|uniref:uncharacterized protein n=1 Tax=Chelonus insularis TaxID=460826 RepID=UPI001588BB4B|nr:uncharacterized protein LOC118075000 [Chelonus insularis]
MSKMKYGRAPKIDLHTEIISLKKQLSMTLGENHLLKVKIRRLEYELKKKDKYMNYFLINSEKHLESQNLAYKKTSNTIMKLRKENEDLKELLFKKELHDQKGPYRTKMTTISCDQVDNKFKNLLGRPRSNFSSRLESLSDSHTLHKNNKKHQRIFSTNSRSVETTEDFLSNYFVTRADADKLMEMINVLKKQQDVDKEIIHARNSEITQLASELKNLKSQFSAENILTKRSNVSDKLLSPKNVNNSLEQDEQTKSSEFIRPKTPLKVLEPVQELNENESSDTSNKSDLNLHKRTFNSHRKTIIEYAIDSEVSSDEEIYLLNA